MQNISIKFSNNVSNCGWCKHSEYIDGILFCNFIFEDVDLNYKCESFEWYIDEWKL